MTLKEVFDQWCIVELGYDECRISAFRSRIRSQKKRGRHPEKAYDRRIKGEGPNIQLLLLQNRNKNNSKLQTLTNSPLLSLTLPADSGNVWGNFEVPQKMKLG